MAQVKHLDTGGDILISGDSREEVEAALRDLVARGAQVITPLSLVGRSWVAACTPPPELHEADRTSTLDLRELQAAAQRERHPEAALCRVEEMGLKRVVTGPTYDAVHARLAELLAEGCTLVSDVQEDFGSWIAICDTGAKAK